MAKSLRAVELLARPEQCAARPVCAVFGDEPFLRRESIGCLRAAVLGGEGGDFSFAAFEGPDAQWPDVLEELATVAMFGPGKRLVLVEDAEDFVSRYRAQLEDYVAAPVARGVLILELKSFPANTRLYKAVAAEGLLIDCTRPAGPQLTRWLTAWAKQRHRVVLAQDAGEELVEQLGPELGLLDQEIAKLALLAGSDQKITAEIVSRGVGGWRAKTTWEMLDAALDGDLPGAVRQLDRLLASGEQPVGLLAQISASLRRLAAATRLVLQSDGSGRRMPLRQALEQAGVRSFVLSKAERQLRRLGSRRGSQLYQRLLEADLDLKGDSSVPPRLVLERLIVWLAASQEALGGGR